MLSRRWRRIDARKAKVEAINILLYAGMTAARVRDD